MRAMRKSPATTSPPSIRSPIPQAQWSRVSWNWRGGLIANLARGRLRAEHDAGRRGEYQREPEDIGDCRAIADDQDRGDDADHGTAQDAEGGRHRRQAPYDIEPQGVGDRIARDAGKGDRQERSGVGGIEMRAAFEHQQTGPDGEERDRNLP